MPIDYSKYPPNWKSEIRPRIMDRANDMCEVEGCQFKHKQYVWSLKLGKGTQREWYTALTEAEDVLHEYTQLQGGSGINPFAMYSLKQVRVILTIAHLDHDEHNLEVKDERLQAMCQLHHLRYDAKEKYRRRTGNLGNESH